MLTGLIFIFNSCENFNDPGDAEYKSSVFMILRSGSQAQEFYIFNTLPLSFVFKDAYPYINSNDVLDTNASITLSDGVMVYDKFELVYNDLQRKNRCYTNKEQITIYPERQYQIRVESNGQNIEGNIHTIGDFNIIDIKKTDTGERYQYYNVTWNKCNGARFYQVNVIEYAWLTTMKTQNGEYVYDSVYIANKHKYPFGLDGLPDVSMFSEIVPVFGKSDSAVIEVEAFDLSTYNYLYKDIRQVNIKNGYGLFGSSTVKSGKLNLRTK